MLVTILDLWFCVSVPLTFLGARFGCEKPLSRQNSEKGPGGRASFETNIRPGEHPSRRTSVQASILPGEHPSRRASFQTNIRPGEHPSRRTSVQASILPDEHPSRRASFQTNIRPEEHPSRRASVQASILPGEHPSRRTSVQASILPDEHPSRGSSTRSAPTRSLAKFRNSLSTQNHFLGFRLMGEEGSSLRLHIHPVLLHPKQHLVEPDVLFVRILFLVLIILVITCSEATILLCYFQPHAEGVVSPSQANPAAISQLCFSS
ncbi:transmembrane 9 superfamily member 2 [Paramormyrops kingsleyae]|uniref:transmembrane 9 superfamily member 2 n=1 Tax=Paramormyrops kingsleyae TaxID=1676925 RepID=UPI003B970FB1